ncbi:MAG: hypothetical protein Q4C72_08075 [Eubacteriales bacterium]|nr:hypothetical protein [Eubacteriales bacterium]
MSENQQPLSEKNGQSEQTALESAETPLPEETEDTYVLSPEEAEEEVEEELDPADVKIFGMPRMCFHGAAFGVAAGYILCGILGLIFKDTPNAKVPSATICAVGCAVVGYFIAKYFYNKRKKDGDAPLSAEDGQQAD